MDEPNPEFAKEILRKVRQIEIRSNRLVSEALAGSYHSAFKGQGIDFEEVREYQPGDEVRSIDWNVTAKMNTPFVKQYREERELTIVLAVDLSASGIFGSVKQSKRERLAELAALLAFSADRNNDKVGLILFTEEIEHYLPPSKGQQHVLRILREILFRKTKGKGTNLRGSLRFLNRVMRRRAVVFLLSDFQIPDNGDDEESAEDILLKELFTTRRRHDLICTRVSDPRENVFPDVGRIVLEDAETGELIEVNTSDSPFRERYKDQNRARNTDFEQRLLRRGIDHFGFSTGKDYVKQLREFFKIRESRRRA
ncbi:MAG: DUF58 domain-containing protein [Opitutae bacterium]|nr:DUF58 domain-containing protein [Opitutae bacterium]|tara:strand:+ start:776 stop:1708 length:933 start_codon:yes stop_codon:yes gene_type:complete